MKHFVRWLICLAFPLNALAFVGLLGLGASMGNTVLLCLAFLTYPAAIGLHALARKHINKKCFVKLLHNKQVVYKTCFI